MTDKSFIRSFSFMIGALIVLTLLIIFLARFVSSSMDEKFAAESQESLNEEITARIQPVGKLNIDRGAAAMTNSADSPAPTETEAPVQEATQPETTQNAASAETAVAATDAADGESVYNTSCIACHLAGIAGAPKLGDAAAWTERINKGMEELQNNAINGFQGYSGVMPPKGGNTALSDTDVIAAVEYMVQQSQ